MTGDDRLEALLRSVEDLKEQLRLAEGKRQVAERERQQAELERQAAEEDRKAAEESRQVAEEVRRTMSKTLLAMKHIVRTINQTDGEGASGEEAT